MCNVGHLNRNSIQGVLCVRIYRPGSKDAIATINYVLVTGSLTHSVPRIQISGISQDSGLRLRKKFINDSNFFFKVNLLTHHIFSYHIFTGSLKKGSLVK